MLDRSVLALNPGASWQSLETPHFRLYTLSKGRVAILDCSLSALGTGKHLTSGWLRKCKQSAKTLTNEYFELSNKLQEKRYRSHFDIDLKILIVRH